MPFLIKLDFWLNNIDNQVVELGEAIAYLEDSRLQTKKKQQQVSLAQNQQQIQQINAQLQTLDRQMAAETDKMQRAIASAKAELKLNQRQKIVKLPLLQKSPKQKQPYN